MIIDAPIGALRPGNGRPRQVFVEEELAELAASIAAHGIPQPLLVAADEMERGAPCYRIIAGERHWRSGSAKTYIRHSPAVLYHGSS